MSRSRFLHVVSYASGLILPSAVAAAWWYRPVVDPGAFCKGNTVDCKSGPVREGMISRYTLSDYADQSEPVLFRIASRIAIFTTVCAARAFMTLAGQFAIKDDENYAYFLQQTVARKEGVPLITVSNHRSLLDEPTIFASLLPFWLNVQPKFLRYSLCAQEYCFYEKLPTLIHAYMGAGHVSPIWRGGGVNQKLLLDYARRVAAGNWCHVFPEGGIWQRKELGGRQNDRVREIGKLKWGIGKLIAHSPQRPIVIPFFFMGTETITPLHPVTKKLEKSIPNIGHKVHLQFGKSIEFDDLIKEHEAQYGPLWKYSASVEIDKQRGYNSEDYHSYWDSRPEDYHLYSKITRRIEKALEEMNENFEAKAVDK